MSAFGGAALLGSSSVNYANKIGHFLTCLLPRKWRWEAHGKQDRQARPVAEYSWGQSWRAVCSNFLSFQGAASRTQSHHGVTNPALAACTDAKT